MSFAKDILGISKKAQDDGPNLAALSTPTPASSPTAPTKRMDGLAREVLMLTGGSLNAPQIAPTATFKEKPQQKVSWVWKSFLNSARKDKLELGHWVKGADAEAAEDYHFAKFSRKVKMLEYTDEEYKNCLQNLQPLPKKTEKEPKGFEPWTREDTDLLFKYCQDYDLRFVVIHDRWPDDRMARTVDELKDRYYSVSRRLFEARQRAKQPLPTGALLKHCNALVSNAFDVEYELIRKKQLEEQYKRSKTEQRLEEETVREARRIEANRKRMHKERLRIQKLLTPAGDIAVTDKEDLPAYKATKGKANKSLPPGTVEPILTLPTKNFQHRKSWNCAHARSSFLYQSVTQSARLAKQVEVVLDELKVGLRPMATASIVEAYDLLRIEILAHIEMQRTVARKEEELHLLRVKLAKLKGETPPPPPPGVNLSHKKRKTETIFEKKDNFGISPAPPSAPSTPLQKRRKKH